MSLTPAFRPVLSKRASRGAVLTAYPRRHVSALVRGVRGAAQVATEVGEKLLKQLLFVCVAGTGLKGGVNDTAQSTARISESRSCEDRFGETPKRATVTVALGRISRSTLSLNSIRQKTFVSHDAHIGKPTADRTRQKIFAQAGKGRRILSAE